MAHPSQSHDEASPVGLVSPGWPAEAMANGIVSYVSTVAAALRTVGIDAHVLTSRPMSDTLEPFVHVVRPDLDSLWAKVMWRISPQGWPQSAFCKALLADVRRLKEQQGLKLLEMEESYGWARLLAGRCPVPLVVRLHGPWFLNGVANGVAQDAAFRQRDGWEKQGILAASGISAPSEHVLRETRAHFGLPLPDAEVIPNPVEPVDSTGRWNLQACDRNRIVFVGRFDRHKGGDTMINAFAYVLARFPNARLDFIGPDRGCLDSNGREWRLKEYVGSRLSPSDAEKVAYHGFQPGSAAAALRKQALVTVAPSRYETFGIATAEAMMAGCPVIVCAAGALTELVQDGHNGLLASPGDAADVGEKVLSLLRNPPLAAELGHQAAADAARRYAPAVVARQTADFYRRTLARASGRSLNGSFASGPNRPASVSA